MTTGQHGAPAQQLQNGSRAVLSVHVYCSEENNAGRPTRQPTHLLSSEKEIYWENCRHIWDGNDFLSRCDE